MQHCAAESVADVATTSPSCCPYIVPHVSARQSPAQPHAHTPCRRQGEVKCVNTAPACYATRKTVSRFVLLPNTSLLAVPEHIVARVLCVQDTPPHAPLFAEASLLNKICFKRAMPLMLLVRWARTAAAAARVRCGEVLGPRAGEVWLRGLVVCRQPDGRRADCTRQRRARRHHVVVACPPLRQALREWQNHALRAAMDQSVSRGSTADCM